MNEDLAKDCRKVIRRANHGATSQAYYVEHCSVDIGAHYRQHGDLRDLHEPSIGPETKHIMELVLKYGVDEAADLYSRERATRRNIELYAITQRRTLRQPRAGSMGDEDPGWDDAVRRYEES